MAGSLYRRRPAGPNSQQRLPRPSPRGRPREPVLGPGKADRQVRLVVGGGVGFALVIVATDGDGVNARVVAEARERSVEVIAERLAVRLPPSARSHAGDV